MATPSPRTPSTGLGPSGWRSPARLRLIGLLAGLVLAGWLLWMVGTNGRSLRSLPPPERQRVYQRTIEDLRLLCGPDRPGALRDHCRELAEIVAPLPECDAECVALVRPILTPAPTR